MLYITKTTSISQDSKAYHYLRATSINGINQTCPSKLLVPYFVHPKLACLAPRFSKKKNHWEYLDHCGSSHLGIELLKVLFQVKTKCSWLIDSWLKVKIGPNFTNMKILFFLYKINGYCSFLSTLTQFDIGLTF